MAVPKSSIQTFDSTGTMNDSARQVSAVSHQPSAISHQVETPQLLSLQILRNLDGSGLPDG
jgi:hypothetical protein